MKRLVTLLFIAFPAYAADPGTSAQLRLWTEAQALTRAAPTLITEGMELHAIRGFRVSICAASGQTLSGAGTLQAYVWDYDLGVWQRNSGLDLTVSATSIRCQAFPDAQTVASSGRVLYAANSVTVSSGTVVVRIKASLRSSP